MGNLEKIDSYINEGRKIIDKIPKAKKYSFHNMTSSDLPMGPGYTLSPIRIMARSCEQEGQMIRASGIEFMRTFLWEIKRLTLEHSW